MSLLVYICQCFFCLVDDIITCILNIQLFRKCHVDKYLDLIWCGIITKKVEQAKAHFSRAWYNDWHGYLQQNCWYWSLLSWALMEILVSQVFTITHLYQIKRSKDLPKDIVFVISFKRKTFSIWNICHNMSICDNISHTSWNTIKIWEFLWKYFPIPMVRMPDDISSTFFYLSINTLT